MEQIRMGIIGIGNMGSAHAMQLYRQKVQGMRLAAVCDCRAERLEWARQNFGEEVGRYRDYQGLLRSETVDAVLIATPHKLHPVIAVEAFAAGLHVLTEKPAGIDTASVRRMNQAAKESGKVFGIMYNQRTNPVFGELRRCVKSGRLGELKRFVWIINNWYRTQAYYDSGSWRATWNGEGGGVLLNQCPHNLDIWQWVAGMPARVRAFCREGHFHRIGVEDDVTVYAEYANGASAVFITSTGEYPGTNRIEISGTKGKAVVEEGVLKLYLLSEDEREICRNAREGMPQEKVEYVEYRSDLPDPAHLGILQNFADAVLNGESLIAPGEEGINGLMIGNACYLSWWTDGWAEIPVDEKEFVRLLEEKQKQETNADRAVKAEKMTGDYDRRWSVRW